MKNIYLLLVLLCLSLGVSAQNNPPISAVSYQKMLHVGIDVDWAKTIKGRIAAQRAYEQGVNVPALFKARGFDHVRIRIKDDVRDFHRNSQTGKALLEELTILVNQCLDAGITPIIAYQAKDFKDHPDSDAALNNVVNWWKIVANNFKNYPYRVAYDLIIETTGKLKKRDNRLNRVYRETTKAIHAIDPKRIVIIAANKISNPFKLKDLEVPQPSDYIMAEWHFYAAGPKRNNPKKKWTTGTRQEKVLIQEKIDAAVAWSNKTGIPTWVGAWMANNYNEKKAKKHTMPDGAPAGGSYSLDEQIAFAKFMSKRLQKAGIPYAVNSDTKYFDRENNRWYGSVERVLDTILRRY